MRGTALAAAAALCCAGLLWGCRAAETKGAHLGAGALPPEGFLRGWHTAGPAEVFEGAGLYGHIDGGAEVFLELGFERLYVQRYLRGKGELSVEIYRMRDPAAALGVYLLKCGRETPVKELGERNTANRWQVLFRKGAFFVQLYNRSGDEETGRDLMPFARYAADRLPDVAGPDPFAGLPAEHRVPGSERVIRGPFTLARTYTLGQGDLLLLEKYGVTAAAAEYEDGKGNTFMRITAAYPDRAAAAAAFVTAKTNLDPYLEVTNESKNALVFKDYAGKGGRIVRSGKVLEILVNLPPGA